MRLRGLSQCFPVLIYRRAHKTIFHIPTNHYIWQHLQARKKLTAEDEINYCWNIQANLFIYFCRGHPVVFIKLKDNKIVSGFSQTQQYIFILTTCCCQLTFSRPFLENLESCTCSTNSIHVMWDPTWMLFALHAPYSKFRKAGLMMVIWPKHVVKIKIK